MTFSAVELSFDPQENINTLASTISRKEAPKAYQILFHILKWKTVKATQCLTLCYPMGYGPPGSSVYGVLQARILEWVAIPFSKGSSQSRDQPRSPALQGDSFPSEPPEKTFLLLPQISIHLKPLFSSFSIPRPVHSVQKATVGLLNYLSSGLSNSRSKISQSSISPKKFSLPLSNMLVSSTPTIMYPRCVKDCFCSVYLLVLHW